MTHDESLKCFVKPPENFYEMTEEEQLARARRLGEEFGDDPDEVNPRD